MTQLRSTHTKPLNTHEGELTVNFKAILVVLLFVVVLAGATGGEESVTRVGDAIGMLAHWINVAWTAMTD